jgi:regulator of sigma E protease
MKEIAAQSSLQMIALQRSPSQADKVCCSARSPRPMLTYVWSVAGCLLPFLFVLSLVVFFHELGHFLIGRWCGVKVETFSLGFGPEIYGFDDRHGTHWRVAALPLGGFVKFHGDANDALIPGETFMKTMSAQERKVSFCTQKVWKRAAIVAAGPIANFVLAVVIYTVIFSAARC